MIPLLLAGFVALAAHLRDPLPQAGKRQLLVVGKRPLAQARVAIPLHPDGVLLRRRTGPTPPQNGAMIHAPVYPPAAALRHIHPVSGRPNVECLDATPVSNFRRLVARYEYHAENTQPFLHLAAPVILLRYL